MAFTFGSNTGMFGGRFAQLFNPGWVKPQSEDAQELRIQKQALQVLEPDSGAQIIDDSLYHSPTLAIEASFQSSAALINEYRAMAVDLDVDMAIDDIINAMITTDEDEPCISLNLDDVDGLSESTKNAIIEEFQIILDLLEMEETAYEKAKSWYVDGRQYYQVVVDDVNKKDGIQALIQLDPRAMKKIKEVTRRTDPESRIEVVDKVDEYYLYNPAWVVDMTGNAALGIPGGIAPHSLTGRIGAQQVLKIPTDAVSFVHSGLMSPEGNLVFSNLEKARKPLNNLRMMRDALVIYRITRAPERRAFYIDVGSLPKKAAAEYVTEYMNRHRTKVNYDPVSGKVSGNSYQQTMLEDFWLPRREGGRGTEIVQLEGGQHLGEIDDIMYFQKLLFRALNVPMNRLEDDGGASLILGGSGAEITRDEWKFNKFVQRLRRRYSGLFKDLLRIQLDLKGICKANEWDEMASKIRFDYASDSYVKNQQESQEMINRLGALAQADAFVGKYFSRDWVRREILKQSDEEITHQDELMETENQADLDNKVTEQEAMNSVDPRLSAFNGLEPADDDGGGDNPFAKGGGAAKPAKPAAKSAGKSPESPSSGTGAIQPEKPSGGTKK